MFSCHVCFHVKANLELNKKVLTADLICMLEERLPANKTPRLKQKIERFFLTGATRIDLIAKCIDLDNEIVKFDFDIANLNETINVITSLRHSGGKNQEIQFIPNIIVIILASITFT